MKKYFKIFLVFFIFPISLSVQPSFGGTLESFLADGEYLKASCDTNDQNSSSSISSNETIIVEMNSNERIQINCDGMKSNAVEDVKNIDLEKGYNIKIVCVPPEKYADVVIPMTLNDTQQILCTSQHIE